VRETSGFMIIAVSDLHLGYEKAEKETFVEFLEDYRWKDVSDLVILGDFVDMWRRDASGVFLEHQDVMAKLLELRARKVTVHIVAGNHDYHLLQLKRRGYPFAFERNLVLGRGKYRFVHGYEYDKAQRPILMEALCRLMSDEVGGGLSSLWKLIQSRSGYLAKYRLPQGLGPNKGIKALHSLRQPPELRLKDSIQDVEKRAARSLRKGEVLIFGHTHRPFVNKKETIVNTGSWVKESRPRNTFVEISAGRISLRIFKNGEITERIDL
jgi:UDP-2,3-diacylglucosamine pyrophosphatase LpxH